MKALVTGGAGFVGSHVVDRLVDEGWEVLVVDDLSNGHLDNLAEARARGQIQFHQIDIRTPDFVTAVERYRPEVIHHLAAQASVSVSVRDPIEDATVNVVGTVNVLEAARRVGAARVVVASSGGAIYGEDAKLPVKETYTKHPDSPYGVSKKVIEDYCHYFRKHEDVDYVLLALSNVYGPRQDPYGEAGVVSIFTNLMLAGRRPVIFGDGTITRDYVYVADVADAFIRAAGKGGGKLLNIGTGVETSVLELFNLLARIAGFEQHPVFGEPRTGDVPRSVVDASAAKKHLGWQPWTSLEDGLRQTVEYFRTRA